MTEGDDAEKETARKQGGTAEYVTVPNTIRGKVSGGGPLTEEMASNAERAIETHAAAYLERAQTQIDELTKSVQEAEGGNGEEDVYEKIFRQSHDIRGLGATFGYTLATQIGTSLCNFLEGVSDHDARAYEVMRAHVDALRAVIANDVKGDGGKVGREIANILAQVVAKYTPAET